MAQFEDEIVAAGAQIIWVLEQDRSVDPGTAESCDELMEEFGSEDQGWCVGDGETMPNPGTFDESPFSVARGFDMVLPRATMEILYVTSHGTPSGNENPEGEDILAAVEDVISGL